jgi:hypothetical protein
MKAFVTNVRLTIPLAVVVASFSTLIGSQALSAQTPAASPEASPVAVLLPDGPLGEQIQWLLDFANGEADQIPLIEEHFSPEFFAEAPSEETIAALTALQTAGIDYEIDPDSIITTMDLPASNGRFILIGSDGSLTEVSVQIDRDSGAIRGLLIQPATDATPSASPAA